MAMEDVHLSLAIVHMLACKPYTLQTPVFGPPNSYIERSLVTSRPAQVFIFNIMSTAWQAGGFATGQKYEWLILITYALEIFCSWFLLMACKALPDISTFPLYSTYSPLHAALIFFHGWCTLMCLCRPSWYQLTFADFNEALKTEDWDAPAIPKITVVPPHWVPRHVHNRSRLQYRSDDDIWLDLN